MTALLPLLGKNGRLYPEKLSEKLPALLPVFNRQVRWLNALLILVGSLLFIVTSWH